MRATAETSMTREGLFDLLCCPVCRGQLVDSEPSVEGAESALRCAACAVDFAVRSGVPDMIPPAEETDDDWDI